MEFPSGQEQQRQVTLQFLPPARSTSQPSVAATKSSGCLTRASGESVVAKNPNLTAQGRFEQQSEARFDLPAPPPHLFPLANPFHSHGQMFPQLGAQGQGLTLDLMKWNTGPEEQSLPADLNSFPKHNVFDSGQATAPSTSQDTRTHSHSSFSAVQRNAGWGMVTPGELVKSTSAHGRAAGIGNAPKVTAALNEGGAAAGPGPGSTRGKSDEGGMSSGSDADDDELDDEEQGSISVGGEDGGAGSRKRKTPSISRAGSAGGKAAAPHAMSHLMTERRRRERLNAQFLALRGVVPNITKMNKLSTLEDAINYIKSLQEKVVTVEARLRLYESAEAGGAGVAPFPGTENAAGSLSNTSSPKEPAAAGTLSLLRPGDAAPGSSGGGGQAQEIENEEEFERVAVEVEAKLVDDQVVLRVQCPQRRGLFAEVGAAIDAAGVDVQQASMMCVAESAIITALSTKVEEGRKVQESNIELALRELLSIPQRSLASFTMSGSGDHAQKRL